jgi:NAD(P)H-hydrate epimerase
VDVPSGVPFSPHILANFTLVLAGLKHEHLFYPSRAACGKILLDPILMPSKALEAPALPELLEPAQVQALLPKRAGNAHKGSVGRVLVMGGYPTYSGAPVLSVLGAYRAGAGLVTLAYPAEVGVLAPLEAVRQPVAAWKPEYLAQVKADTIAVGMGCGPQGEDAAIAALELNRPTVLDADALHPDVLEAYKRSRLPFIITPHPGEAGRLLDMSPDEVLEDPLDSARRLAELYHCVVVLKGGPSIIAVKNGGTTKLAINTTGNAAMATGGMGDVLAGAIAALLAAGLSGWDAGRAGVYLHGLAGDQVGRIGMLAHELAEALPGARDRLEAGQVKAFWM